MEDAEEVVKREARRRENMMDERCLPQLAEWFFQASNTSSP